MIYQPPKWKIVGSNPEPHFRDIPNLYVKFILKLMRHELFGEDKHNRANVCKVIQWCVRVSKPHWTRVVTTAQVLSLLEACIQQ